MRQFYSLLFSAILAAHLLTPAQGPGGQGDESIYSLEAPVYGVVQKGKALEPLPGPQIEPAPPANRGSLVRRLFGRKPRSEEEIRRSLPPVQKHVDVILLKPPENADKLVADLRSAGIKAVVVVQETQSDLKTIKKSFTRKGLKFETLVLPSGHSLVLPKAVKKLLQEQILVIDFDESRLAVTSQSHPVAVSQPQFTLSGLEPFPKPLPALPRPRITQQDVNDFIVRSKKAGTLTAKTLVDQLIIWGIKVLAFDFDGTLTEAHSHGHLYLGDSKKVNAIYDGVTPDFLAIAKESYRRLRLYVVSFTDEGYCEKLSDEEKKLCLAGKPLVESVLLRKGVVVDEIYGYYPKFYKTPEAYRLVNPGAKKGETMPNSKAFHLHLVERHAGVPPHQIILFDDTLENCKDAVKRGYFAVGVKPEGKVKGLRFTTMSPVVPPQQSQSMPELDRI